MVFLRSARKMKWTLSWSESRWCRNLPPKPRSQSLTMEARILRLAWRERWAISHLESGGGQVRSSEPSQGVVDAASSSTAGGRSQGDARDTHHSPFDAKEVVAVSHATTPQTSQDTTLGALGTGSPVPGQSALVNSTHRESAPEPMSDAQLKGLSSPQVRGCKCGPIAWKRHAW